MAQREVASVTSQPRPQSGQKHRSSGNFSVQNLPAGTIDLVWKIEAKGKDDAYNISFDVKEDKSAAKDPTHFSGVKHENRTSVKTARNFYIANPSGASTNFLVRVYARY